MAWRVNFLLLLLISPAWSRTIWVDGECVTSGTGVTSTCGAAGPWKTINEGIIDAMKSVGQEAVTINIRGAHDTFEGRYYEYVKIWGSQALTCSAEYPCVLQGYNGERPIISGFLKATSGWTGPTSGVYSRGMASRGGDPPNGQWAGSNDKPDDAFYGTNSGLRNPVYMLEGLGLTQMPYGGSCNGLQTTICSSDNFCTGGQTCDLTKPKDGYWAFKCTGEPVSSCTVYVNPTGANVPGVSYPIWVPDKNANLMIDGRTSCPDSTTTGCPVPAYITLKTLEMEGARWTAANIQFRDSLKHGLGIRIEDVIVNDAPRYGIRFQNLTEPVIDGYTYRRVARGLSYVPAGTFGLRIFNFRGGVMKNLVGEHIGSAGKSDGDMDGVPDSGGSNRTCQVCDSPWNDPAYTSWSGAGQAWDLKQSSNVVVDGFTATDIAGGIRIDAVDNVLVKNGVVTNTRNGIIINQLTPNTRNKHVRTYNVTVQDVQIHSSGENVAPVLYTASGMQSSQQQCISPLQEGEYLKFQNVLITRPMLAGIGVCYNTKVCQGGRKDLGTCKNLGDHSWSAVTTGMSGSALLVNDVEVSSELDSVDERTTIYAGTEAGVYKTVNQGDNWVAKTTAPLGAAAVADVAVDPVTPTTVYALTRVGSMIYKSTDGGGSWALSSSGLPNGSTGGYIAIDPVAPSTIYVALAGNNVYKSTNSGASWAAANTGITSSRVTSLVIDTTTPSTLYVGTDGAGVFKSTNSGSTWAAANTGLTATEVRGLAMSPASVSTIYAATAGGVYKTIDAAATWTAVNAGLFDLDAYSIAVNPDATSVIWAGTSSGVLRSNNKGSGWSDASTGIYLQTVYRVAGVLDTSGTVFAATDTGVWRSRNGGQTECPVGVCPVNTPIYWTYQSGSYTNLGGAAAHPSNTNQVAMTSGAGKFTRSEDGGATWQSYTNGLTALFYGPVVYDVTNPDRIYIASDVPAQVCRSTDRGVNWTCTTVSVGATRMYPRSLAVDHANSSHLWVATLSGLYESYDYGQNWTENATFPGAAIPNTILIHPTDHTIVYVGTESNGVYKTTDNGTTWTAKTTGFTCTLGCPAVNDLVFSPKRSTTLFAATNDGVYTTKDEGEKWSAKNTGLTGGMIGIQANPKNGNVYLTFSNGIIYKTDNSGSSWYSAYDGLVVPGGRGITVDPVTGLNYYLANPLGVYKWTDTGSLPCDDEATCVESDGGAGTVELSHNTIWGHRENPSPNGTNWSTLNTSGIIIGDDKKQTSTPLMNGVKIKNNIISGMNVDGIFINYSTFGLSDGLEMEGNVYYDPDASRQCAVRIGLIDNATASRCYADRLAFRVDTGFEVFGLETDPLLVDPAGGNFHLQSSSPVIDQGVDADGAAPYDFEGNPRPWGDAADAGIDEYRGNVSTLEGSRMEGAAVE